MCGKKAADLLKKPKETKIFSKSVLQNGAELLTKTNSHLSPDICVAEKLLTC
jgi:hypothetical protein